MKNPCRECDTRHYKCHSICDRYKEYADIMEDLRQKNKQEADITGYYADMHHKRIKQNFRQLKTGNTKK